jgi:hypothetical protein
MIIIRLLFNYEEYEIVQILSITSYLLTQFKSNSNNTPQQII